MKVSILPSAWDDLADGFHFYEQQQPGLGDDFRESLIAEIETLEQTAGIHRQIFGWHRQLAPRFPYAVYYSIAADHVIIRAVLDCRRDPRWIRRKLK